MAEFILPRFPQNSQFDGAIPEPVLINMLHTGRLLLAEPARLDERLCCRYARNNDIIAAAACPSLRHEPNRRPWCGLNGSERRSPCVFDEPNDAAIWQRIRDYIVRCRARGWPI